MPLHGWTVRYIRNTCGWHTKHVELRCRAMHSNPSPRTRQFGGKFLFFRRTASRVERLIWSLRCLYGCRVVCLLDWDSWKKFHQVSKIPKWEHVSAHSEQLWFWGSCSPPPTKNEHTPDLAWCMFWPKKFLIQSLLFTYYWWTFIHAKNDINYTQIQVVRHNANWYSCFWKHSCVYSLIIRSVELLLSFEVINIMNPSQGQNTLQSACFLQVDKLTEMYLNEYRKAGDMNELLFMGHHHSVTPSSDTNEQNHVV